MKLVNIEQLPEETISEVYGVVSGSCVQSKHVFRDIAAGIKNFFGGELKGYTELLEESRSTATERMIKQAEDLGADAIINIRFSTSSITQGASEVYVYGTAVKLDRK